MNTLFLDNDTWDLAVDTNGNIAMAENPYALAQDAASEVQTYRGEVYFNTTIGIPYFQEILGYGLPLNLYRQYAVNAALTVPEVVSAQLFFVQLENRVLSAQLQLTDVMGRLAAINVALPVPQQPNPSPKPIPNTAIAGAAIAGAAIAGKVV